ncbi:PLXB3-like protein [Mya arenaria]|uniref:PLXB3-like protein n=1 Tax=Mya arenaria TaxID=6604 RepID=A0ABY7G1G2_MYAAR|nr:PLXB3-like protein [Mya arenaria]
MALTEADTFKVKCGRGRCVSFFHSTLSGATDEDSRPMLPCLSYTHNHSAADNNPADNDTHGPSWRVNTFPAQKTIVLSPSATTGTSWPGTTRVFFSTPPCSAVLEKLRNKCCPVCHNATTTPPPLTTTKEIISTTFTTTTTTSSSSTTTRKAKTRTKLWKIFWKLFNRKLSDANTSCGNLKGDKESSKMNILMGLLALIVSESGLHGAHVHIARSTILMNDMFKYLGLNHMFMAVNGTSLYVTGKNYIYHLDTADDFHDLTEIDNVQTGPNDDANGEYKIDDVTNIVIPYGSDYLITCGSSYTFCHKRFLGNISDWTIGFEPSTNNSAAAAFFADFDNKEYLFVGCPHAKLQPNTICEKFGIFWFNDLDITRKVTRFKTADDLLLITETYVKGFAIDHHRLFFSIQRNKTDNSTHSRVANVCQNNNDYAPIMYVDMELKCGDFNYMQAVAKTCFEGECLIVATFTQGEHSVVCAYLFSEIKSSLAVNVKRCYDKTLQLPPLWYDYFNYPNGRPCTGNPANLTGINTTDEYFLCNEDGYASFKDVIGDTALKMNASIRLNHTAITALTLVSVRGRVLALLGTAKGEIIKAIVFPREVAEVLSWKAIVDSGHAVLPDMFVYGYKLYTFSENLVKRIELTECSQFSTCDKCMESKDIFLRMLTLTLSHNLSIGLGLRCQFESLVNNRTILMNSSVPGVGRGDEITVLCRSPDWTELKHHIQKAIQSHFHRSPPPPRKSQAFESFVEIDEESNCPLVTNYAVSAPNVLDSSGVVHLAIEESYNITVNGVNFIDVQQLSSY